MAHIILINKKSCLKNINLIGELDVPKRYIMYGFANVTNKPQMLYLWK